MPLPESETVEFLQAIQSQQDIQYQSWVRLRDIANGGQGPEDVGRLQVYCGREGLGKYVPTKVKTEVALKKTGGQAAKQWSVGLGTSEQENPGSAALMGAVEFGNPFLGSWLNDDVGIPVENLAETKLMGAGAAVGCPLEQLRQLSVEAKNKIIRYLPPLNALHMSKPKLIFVSLVLFVISSFPVKSYSQSINDVKGFRNTTWDMSSSEVSDSLKSVISKSEKINPYQLPYFRELCIQDYEIGNFKYRVDFYFSNKDSTLSMVEINQSSEDASVVTYEEVSEILTKKYGEPTSENKEERPFGNFGVTEKEKLWVFPTTTLKVRFYSGSENPKISGSTRLRYTPTENKSTDKI